MLDARLLSIWRNSAECDGLCRLIAELWRQGGSNSEVASVLGHRVPELLAPHSLLAVATLTPGTRRFRRTVVQLFDAAAVSTAPALASIPRPKMPSCTRAPRPWEVRILEYSQDGSMLALGFDDRRGRSAHLHLLCASSDKLMQRFTWRRASVNGIAISPNGQTAAVSLSQTNSQDDEDGCVCLLRLGTRAPVQKMVWPWTHVASVAFSRCGEHLAAVLHGIQHEVRIFTTDTLTVARVVKLPDGELRDPRVAVSPSTGNVLVASGSESFYVVSPSARKAVAAVSEAGESLRAIACYSGRGLAAIGAEANGAGHVHLFDESALAMVARAELPHPVFSMAYEPRDRRLVVEAFSDTTESSLWILDADSLVTLQSVRVNGLALSLAISTSPQLHDAAARAAAEECCGSTST